MRKFVVGTYLPLTSLFIFTGIEYMEKFELAPKEEGYAQLYDATVNPSITNVFAAAAFRFGHSLVASQLQ